MGKNFERARGSICLCLFFVGAICCSGDVQGDENRINPFNESYVKDSFRDDFEGTAIDSISWQVAGWKEHNGQTGPERCYVKDGYLVLEFINTGTSFLSSAIQTRHEFLFGKWEARLKSSDVPGVVNAMYTIDWDTTTYGSDSDGTKQEIDIEFLTYVKERVHFAVHAADRKSFDTNPDIIIIDKDGKAIDPSADFHVWAFNILPDRIEWSVDGNILKVYHYTDGDVAITAPYQLKFNSWSSVKPSSGYNWMHGPPEVGRTCTFMIDWIRFTPYSGQ